MKAEQHEQQAQQFLSYHAKRFAPWEEDFAFWADSKDFGPADRFAIRSRVVAELIAAGEIVITDPDDVALPEDAA